MDRIRAGCMAWGMALLCGIAASVPVAASAEEAVSPAPQWSFGPEPVWQDEFDQAGPPDPAKWGYDIGGKG